MKTDDKKQSRMLHQIVGSSHHTLVFKRRIQKLANAISPYLQPGSVLDVGSGNGMLGALLMSKRSDINIVGIDVHLREEHYIPTALYDGSTIPYEDNTFAAVMIVDVLHHTDNPAAVLGECLRVSHGVVVIKDHFYSNLFERGILRFMDWVGNAPYGVRLPYNYFTRDDWEQILKDVHATEIMRQNNIPQLYPVPFQWVIGRRIQFLAQIKNS